MELLSEIFSPVQLLAWVAGLLYFISYQRQSGHKTIMLWAPADFLFALHYYFMNAPLFLIMAVGGTIRSVLALKTNRKILLSYLIFYVLLLVAVFPFLAEGLKDYFGMVGTICFCLSVWMKHHFIWHRVFAFGHQLCWLVAFILLGSYGGLAFTALVLSSNVIGTGRYILTQKNNVS